MKNALSILFILISCMNISVAQREVKEKKYSDIRYNDISQDRGNYVIYVVDAVSNDAYFKCKLRIHNKSTDYIMVDINKCKVIAGGTEYTPTEKPMVIGPGDFGNRVIDIKGTEFRHKEITINLNGLFIAPSKGTNYEAPAFKLPVSSNEFTSGPFKVTNKEVVAKTDITEVYMVIMYTGTEVGVFYPANAVLKMPVSGNEFSNMNPKRIPILLAPGEVKSFKLLWENIDPRQHGDMQKVNMQILFKDAFMETKAAPMESSNVVLTINEKESK